MTKFLILHGTDASPTSHWYIWLKGRLIGLGHNVWLPQLPDSDKPNAKAYTKYILANKDFVLDSDTVIIGHLSGAVEALNVLQNLSGSIKVKATILVSVFKDDLGSDTLTGLFEESFDFEAIRNHSTEFILLHSDNDPHVPIEHAEYMEEQLHGELLTIEGQGDFSTEQSPDYKQFPELLDIIESIITE